MAMGGASGGGGNAKAIEAGRAFVRLGVKDELSGQLKQIAAKLNTAGGFLMKAGGVIAAPFLAAIPLIGGAVAKLGDLTQIDRIAKAFGASGESMSGLLGVLKAIGSETKEDIEGLTQFAAKVNEAAAGGSGEGAKLFEGLAVSAKELIALPIDEQFFRIHAAIRQLPQPMQMFKLSMLGGTDSMKKWIPLLSMSNDEVRRLAKTMEVSQTELNAASRATGALALMTAVLGRAWDLVAVGVAPVIENLAVEFTKILIPVKEWLVRNRELVGILFAVGLRVAAVGAAIFATGVAFKLGAFALGIYRAAAAASIAPLILLGKAAFAAGVAIWTALGGPAVLAVLGLTAVLGGLAVAFFTLTEGGRQLWREWAGAIGDYFGQTAANAKSAYGGVVDAMRGGDLQLAWSIVTAFLDLEWKRVWGEAKRILREVWNFFGSGWDSAVYLLKSKWEDFTAWMKKLWVDAVAFMNTHFRDEMRGVMDQVVPKHFIGVKAVVNAVAQDPKAFKGQIDAERDAAKKRLTDAFDLKNSFRKLLADILGGADAKAVADAQKKLAELNLLAAQKAADAGKANNDHLNQQMDRMAQTVGLFASQTGSFLTQALGPRSASPLEKKADKQIQILGQIRDAVQNVPGMVWG